MKELIKKVLEPFDCIEFALLFGSYAKKTNLFLSDVDIAIFTNKELDLLEIGELIFLLEESLNKKVDLVILNNLEKENAKFAFNIVNNHEVILLKNKKKYIDFKADTYKYYFDLQPMYEMFDNNFKERLKNGLFGQT